MNLVATIHDPTFEQPGGIAYDEFTRAIIVVNYGYTLTTQSHVDVISGLKVVRTFHTACSDPNAVIVTPTDRIFVGAWFICVYDASNYRWIADRNPAIDGADAFAWDSGQRLLYVAGGDGFLLAMNTSTLRYVRTIDVPIIQDGLVSGLTYSPVSNDVYVLGLSDLWIVDANGVFHALYIHSGAGGSGNAIAVSLNALGYISQNRDVYVCGTVTNTIYVVS